MKIKWIGQAGLLIEADEKIILVDPYLSNSVEKVNPYNYRRVRIDEDLFNIKPNVIVLTHNHLDHTDPDTLKKYLNEDSNVLVLAPEASWQTVRTYGGQKNNYVMFNPGTHWTEGNIEFYAVKAEHSDIVPIGVIMFYDNKKIYITGDTLYNENIFSDIPKDIDVVFLPINGIGNNMNAYDAKKFAEKIGAKKAVPFHIGMFDEIDPRTFDFNGAVIPTIYSDVDCF